MYISNSLDERGPTNQLFNIITHLNKKKYRAYLLILTSKKNNKEITRFKKIGVKILNSDVNIKWYNLFSAINHLKKIFKKIRPDIIHTHGLIPDLISLIFKKNYQFVITSRNIPYFDYPGKYGYLLGSLMAHIHLYVFKKSHNLVSCSKSMNLELNKKSIDSLIIKNGVKVSRSKNHTKQLIKYQKPIFIFVGSMIKRKNVGLLIKIMSKYIIKYKGSLLIIGDGPLLSNYSFKNRNKNIHFLGHKTDVEDYFLNSDYYISLSLSEGLPNSVLESLSFCKPVILSNIESHREIKNDFSKMVTITKHTNADKIINEIVSATKKKYPKMLDKQYIYQLSSNRMSSEYQNLYDEVINREI